ncbi:MAG: hypothetical protein AUJ98_05285 [Bacteroidetes bacterium CG2_30_33_31]|nr:MAG: hypothetical protein AUJ98_05285 [Bacteroidetes bacterium CG2_30_33_31]
MKKFFKNLFVLVVISLLVNSCYKDRFSTDKIAGGEWNPDLAAPLIKSKLTMAQIIENSSEIWSENPDGLLSLTYRQKDSSQNSLNVVTIPDQFIDSNFRIVLPSGMIPNDSTYRIFNLDANIVGSNGELVDSIFVKHGSLDFEITTNINHESTVQIIIPELTRYGVTFIQNIKIPSAGGASHTVLASFPLNLYTARFQHPNGNDNKLSEFVKVMVKFGPHPDNSPYNMYVKQSVRNVTYYNAYGYFGQYNFNIDQGSLGMSLFDNSTIDQIFLEDPKLHLKFYNSFGLPIKINMDELYVEKDGIKKNFISTLLSNLVIGAATSQKTFDTTVFTFDKSNSNIVDIFNFQPTKMVFKESCTTNPAGGINNNFVFDNSKVYVDAEIELPMYGRTLNFTLKDSGDLNIEKVAGVKSAELRFNLSNMFPADAYVQFYLADSNYVILDSLLPYNEQLLISALVGPPPEYRTYSPLNKTTVVVLSGDKLNTLFNSKKIIFAAKLSTSEQGQKVVKIYSDYGIDIKLALKLNYLSDF